MRMASSLTAILTYTYNSGICDLRCIKLVLSYRDSDDKYIICVEYRLVLQDQV